MMQSGMILTAVMVILSGYGFGFWYMKTTIITGNHFVGFDFALRRFFNRLIGIEKKSNDEDNCNDCNN